MVENFRPFTCNAQHCFANFEMSLHSIHENTFGNSYRHQRNARGLIFL